MCSPGVRSGGGGPLFGVIERVVSREARLAEGEDHGPEPSSNPGQEWRLVGCARPGDGHPL
jgi:hypothetical protein